MILQTFIKNFYMLNAVIGIFDVMVNQSWHFFSHKLKF